MRLDRSILFLAIAAVCASAASAQGFVGAGIGQSKAHLDCSGTLSCDKSDTAFKVFGGYMFTPNFGLEGVYYNQGKAKVTGTDATLGLVTGEFKGDGLGLYALAVLPVDKASFFAKLGLVSTQIKLDATSSVFGGAGTSERHASGGWGLGAGYDFDKAWSGRVEFERVRVKFMDEKFDVDLVTLSAIYRF